MASNDDATKAKTLLSAGVGLFVVTRGVRGAIAWHGEAGAVEVDAQPAEVVDTVGAGDSFQPGSSLRSRSSTGSRLDRLPACAPMSSIAS